MLNGINLRVCEITSNSERKKTLQIEGRRIKIKEREKVHSPDSSCYTHDSSTTTSILILAF
jgi:heterodisulfide reductase subunit B